MESHRYSDPVLFPERLGRYEVLLPIASGGMATVYLARAVGAGGFERDVALKLTHFFLREDPEFVASLMDEARLAGRIRHPNVVSVIDVGEDPHGVFIVMEYVEGDSLANLQRVLRKQEQRIPLGVTLRLLDDLLSGLHEAHELRDDQGEPLWLVHRDVTPHNVLMGMDGVAKLTDFGIAKAASRLGNTATGLVKGKVAYMAPEQAQGHGIDRRVDVWAAGVLAWEALTGARLYEGTNDAAILLKIVREPPMRARAIRPEIPREIDQAVAKALSLNAAERHPTAEAFAEALSSAARAAGVVRAERREVSEFLRPLVGERLTARRERALEVLGARRRAEGVVPSRPPSAPPLAPQDATEVVPRVFEPATTVTEAADQTQTGTAGISTMARSIMPPRRPKLLLLFVLGGVAAAAGLLAWLGSGDDGPSAPAAASVSARSTPTPSAATSPAPPESATAAPPEPSASAAKPATHRPKLAPRVGTGKSTQPTPLGNPYKKP